jgi:hypothetical protein
VISVSGRMSQLADERFCPAHTLQSCNRYILDVASNGKTQTYTSNAFPPEKDVCMDLIAGVWAPFSHEQIENRGSGWWNRWIMFHYGDFVPCHFLGKERHICGMKGSIHCRKQTILLTTTHERENTLGENLQR